MGDGAAGAIEGDFGDAIAVHAQVHAALVAARRVVAVGDAVGRGQLPAVARTAVVVEDDLLIELGEIGGHGGEDSGGKFAKRKAAFWIWVAVVTAGGGKGERSEAKGGLNGPVAISVRVVAGPSPKRLRRAAICFPFEVESLAATRGFVCHSGYV